MKNMRGFVDPISLGFLIAVAATTVVVNKEPVHTDTVAVVQPAFDSGAVSTASANQIHDR